MFVHRAWAGRLIMAVLLASAFGLVSARANQTFQESQTGSASATLWGSLAASSSRDTRFAHSPELGGDLTASANIAATITALQNPPPKMVDPFSSSNLTENTVDALGDDSAQPSRPMSAAAAATTQPAPTVSAALPSATFMVVRTVGLIIALLTFRFCWRRVRYV